MDVILHIGAHRCATTTFQNYLRQNTAWLRRDDTGFWGPRRTRGGLFQGLMPAAAELLTGHDPQRRAVGRVRMNLERCTEAGVRRLIVSDENMMGTMQENLRMAELYCGVGERMARYAQAFEGYVSDIMLNVRALDSFWASLMGYGVTRGRGVPGAAALDRLVRGPRSWRHVIEDVACAFPGTRIRVLPFETFGGRPETQLEVMTGRPAPKTHARGWLNATPRLPKLRAWLGREGAGSLPEGSGRWHPFTPSQATALREIYADDLMWLAAGADGLATLVEDPDKNRAGLNPPPTELTRGSDDDDEDRRMAGAG